MTEKRKQKINSLKSEYRDVHEYRVWKSVISISYRRVLYLNKKSEYSDSRVKFILMHAHGIFVEEILQKTANVLILWISIRICVTAYINMKGFKRPIQVFWLRIQHNENSFQNCTIVQKIIGYKVELLKQTNKNRIEIVS